MSHRHLPLRDRFGPPLSITERHRENAASIHGAFKPEARVLFSPPYTYCAHKDFMGTF